MCENGSMVQSQISLISGRLNLFSSLLTIYQLQQLSLFENFVDLYTHIHILMLQLHLTVSDRKMSWIIYRRNNLWLDWDWWVFIKFEQGVPSRIVNYRDAAQICDSKNDNQRSTAGYNHIKRSPRCVQWKEIVYGLRSLYTLFVARRPLILFWLLSPEIITQKLSIKSLLVR